MLPLRFRVYHPEWGMSKPFDLQELDPETFGIYFDDPEKALGNLVGQTILWSTGLKDRNGTEIFEGDIVRLNGRGDCRSDVRWIDGAFRVEQWEFREAMEDNFHQAWVELWVEQDCEVIGNIHANPSLLTAHD